MSESSPNNSIPLRPRDETVSSREEDTSAAESPVSVPDVLIVGGGVFGLATACELLSLGYSTVIVDDAPERSATKASAGMLSPFSELDLTSAHQELMITARQSYPEFLQNVERTSGQRIEANFPGTLYLDPRSETSLGELTFQFREMGAEASYLTPDDVAQTEPELETGEGGAILLAEEGYVNPRALHQALRSAFELLGGVWEQQRVQTIEFDGDQVRGVRTEESFLPARSVLCAAGAWGDRFLTEKDRRRYDPTPVRGEIVRVRPPRRQDRLRHVIQVRNEVYLVPQEDGTILIGATSYPGDNSGRVASGGVRELLERAARYVPVTEQWEFVEAWSGVRPKARGGDPQLVDDPRTGLFHALGLYRHGMLLGPSLGARMARRVAAYLYQSGSRRELLG